MYMKEAGYRVYFRPEWVIPFVEKYTSFFKVMQVKATQKFMDDVYLQSFASYCQKKGIEKLSFHLPEETLVDENRCERVCDFISENDENCEVTMVTSFWGNLSESDYFSYALAKVAKDRAVTIALENVKVGKNLLKYFDALKELAITHGFKVCLDLGYLFYSINKSNTPADLVVDYFKKDSWWKENIVELHMHDYTAVGCHKNIGEGLLYKSIWHVRDIIEYVDDDVPIFFETTIQDIETQGVIEVREFFNRLNGTEEKKKKED